MADLAQAPARRSTQRRLTTNRSSILPSRRETDLNPMAVRSDMRTAVRGDGGADELRRVLDGFTGAVGRGMATRIEAEAPQMEADANQGILDAQTGEMDEAYAKSLAYQEAFYAARTERRFNDFKPSVNQMVDEALANGADPEDIDELLTAQVQNFLDEAIGDLPETASLARREAAGNIVGMVGELSESVRTRIKERADAEFDENIAVNITTALSEGRPLDFQSNYRRLAAAGRTPAQAKTTITNAVLTLALDRNDPRPELLEELLEAKQDDGKTPVLNAAEQLQVMDRLTQARNLRDKVEQDAHNERRDELLNDLFTKALDGEDVSDAIFQAGREGVFTPQETSANLGLIRGLQQAQEEGTADEDFALDVEYRAAMGRPYSNAQIMAFHREGRFGTGRSAYRAAIRALTPPSRARGGGGNGDGAPGGVGGSGMSRKEAKAYALSELKLELVPDTPSNPANPYDRRMNAEAISYFNSLQDGRRGRLPATQALEETRAFLDRAAKNRARREGRAPAPTNRAIPASQATYRWTAEGVRQN